MKRLIKNYSLQNNSQLKSIRKSVFTIGILLLILGSNAQIANYVSNGGFEEYLNTTSTPLAKYWGATDTTKVYGQLLSETLPPYLVPLSSYGYQWPRHGNNYLGTLLYCATCPYNKRGYPRNRLKRNLLQGQTYCVSIYVNLTNQSTHGIDAIGCYFSDNSIDTIKLCNIPITFLLPQILNTPTNIITDTLGWVQIKGQFTATGTEKYMLVGNFKSDANTNKTLVNSANLPGNAANYLIDDVSVIPIDLPAFAGRDTTCIPGTSVYLGRQRDVEIDESCRWYKLPVTITPTTPAIDTAAGIWVSPTQTSTYVVRQQLWCSGVKWDTVVVYEDHVGLDKTQILNDRLKLFPNPALNELRLTFEDESLFKDFLRVSVYDKLGSLIREEDVMIKNKTAYLNTEKLPDGAYYLRVKNENSLILNKGFFVSH